MSAIYFFALVLSVVIIVLLLRCLQTRRQEITENATTAAQAGNHGRRRSPQVVPGSRRSAATEQASRIDIRPSPQSRVLNTSTSEDDCVELAAVLKASRKEYVLGHLIEKTVQGEIENGEENEKDGKNKMSRVRRNKLCSKIEGGMSISDFRQQEGPSSPQSRMSASESNAPSCTICLDNYNEGDKVCWSKNPACEHAFHKHCIMNWLMSGHDDCPNCRTNYFTLVGDDAA